MVFFVSEGYAAINVIETRSSQDLVSRGSYVIFRHFLSFSVIGYESEASVSSWYDFQRQNLPIPKMCFTGSKLLERVPTNLFQKVTLGENLFLNNW